MSDEVIKTLIISASSTITTIGLAYIAARWHITNKASNSNDTTTETYTKTEPK